MITDAPNLNTLWAELIVEELIRNGVDTFVISPGSRSTPLTVAAARNPKAKTVVHYDERGAAFFALGVAKALGSPCALICTSGTAVANYFPAIVEASMSYVPLIVLTADRPPELQNTGANQTINQTHIYGEYVRHFVAMPCPDKQVPAKFVLDSVEHAITAARGARSGPVHVNCPYREPLIARESSAAELEPDLQPCLHCDRPVSANFEPQSNEDFAALQGLPEIVELLQQKTKILVVVGSPMCLKNTSEPLDVPSMFCSRPIFADITSGQRVAKDGPFTGYTVENYDLLLRSNSFRELCRPDAVVHIGGPLVSKTLQEHLTSVRPELYVQIADRPGKMDPYNCVTHRLMCTADQFGFFWGPDLPTETHDWALRLSIASERAGKAMWETLKDQKFPTEIEVAILLGQLAHDYPMDALFLGNSMPIRYFDMYSGLLPQSTHVIANRGASGIDGNIATAAGHAKASGVHVTAIIGDLATLHDLNSLALLRQEDVRVTLIVINNNGGGIFHFLPIAEYGDMFEKYFATPHGTHFDDAARMFGLPYARPTTRDEFAEAYNKARASGASSIIEVVTDREENVKVHRRITDAVVKALEDL